MSRILEEMIKESEYKLTQFQSSSIDAIEQNIIKIILHYMEKKSL